MERMLYTELELLYNLTAGPYALYQSALFSPALSQALTTKAVSP